jgi:hypothetical protein
VADTAATCLNGEVLDTFHKELRNLEVRIEQNVTAPVAESQFLELVERVAHKPRECRLESKGIIQDGGNIKIETYAYDFMPVIHGFRLGNGDLFYSILSWQADGKIGRESYSYQYIACDDNSTTALAIREIFDSWFERARSRHLISTTA